MAERTTRTTKVTEGTDPEVKSTPDPVTPVGADSTDSTDSTASDPKVDPLQVSGDNDQSKLQVDGSEQRDTSIGDDEYVRGAELPSSYYDAEAGPEFVKITRDVVENFYYPGTKRPAQRILFTAGQVVPKAQIDALTQG